MARNLKHADRRQVHPFQFLKALKQSIRQLGGVRNLGRRVLGVYRNEGVVGLVRGMAALYVVIRRRSQTARNDYEKWVVRYDTLTEDLRNSLLACVESFNAKPVVSVIMPVYNPEPQWLEEAIESVLRQIYPNWELCIADDASTNAAIRPILERYQKLDPRISVTFRECNGHISAASNSALSMARGEWIALFDHDDLLSPNALFWIVDAINRYPNASLIYSDEDKITSAGLRCAPHFKPDWNYELFMSYNMICHLGAYRQSLVSSVGGFRLGFEGAQDYDLALRCIEQLTPAQIVHVPRVLYHWRMHRESTAAGGQSKPYALPAGERALNEHLIRRGIAGHAESQRGGYYRMCFELADELPLVSLIILARDCSSMVRRCVETIRQHTRYGNYEIVVVADVDHGVEPNAVPFDIDSHEVRTIAGDRSQSSAALTNSAVQHAKGDFVCLINPAIQFSDPDWLEVMLALAVQSGVGAVGPKLLQPDGKILHAGYIVGVGGIVGDAHRGLTSRDSGYLHRAVLTQSMSAVSGECLLVRKSIYEEANGLRTQYGVGPLWDVDFCLRLREAGYRNVYAGQVALYRDDSQGSAAPCNRPDVEGPPTEEHLRTFEQWRDVLVEDPAYSPNLTKESEDFSLAWPPRLAALPRDVDAA